MNMGSSARRGTLSKLIPTGVVGGLGGMVAQGYYAGHRTLPHFLDQDATGRFGTPGTTPIRIVAIGDSTLTGPGLLDIEDLWICQTLDRLDPIYDIELHVLAKGGAWTRDIRKNQLEEALDLKPDIAIVSGGSNDSIRGVSLRSIRRVLVSMAEALVEVASSVILPGVGDMGSIPRLPQPLATVLSWRSRAADRVHANVTSTHPDIVHLPMWDDASGPFREDPDRLFGPDEFHPSAAGQTVWADLGFPVISAACRRVAGADLS